MRSKILYIVLLLSCTLLHERLYSQTPVVYTIKADSVKITNCDSAELILENHTQGVPGFLFNTGKGRTQFRRGLVNLGNNSVQIGADTLNAWMQGGNSFGATGVLGTNDNHHLDLYTNGVRRARLDSTGNLLIGTTTDNGNLLQVNGNTSIGSATITNTGSLIGTNAILFNHVVSQIPVFQLNDIFVSQLDNVLYNYQYRFNTTSTTGSDGSLNLDIVIPSYEIATGYAGIVYPEGKVCLCFWEGGIPQTISITMYDSVARAWVGPFTSSTNLSPSPSPLGYFEVAIPGSFNFVTEIKITMTPPTGGWINLQNLEYVLSNEQGLANPFPYVGKFGTERLYNFMYFGAGANNNVCLSPLSTYPSYFMNNLGLGTTSPSAQLHTTGSVRFAGLTQDSTQTRVLVSDANGNLYYRSASSLAIDEPLRSSLAVNGPITAKSLRLSATGWPDYVFDSTYSLPPLADVGTFIHNHHHLPGLASAGEVQKDGYDVGATQEALLKKIEELTLYNIDQSKRIDAQNEKLAAQEKALMTLKAEVEELKKLVANKPAEPTQTIKK